MTFGDPIIYICPTCDKQMAMLTYRSYTVHHSEVYSDGYNTGKPNFTPDLAKCPYCDTLFFRHNAKETKVANRKKIEDIKRPERSDLLKATKENITKTWQEKKQLYEDLWRIFNHGTRKGAGVFTDHELTIWKDICSELLLLSKKALKNKSEKSTDHDNLLIQVAELHRNLSEFGKCLKLLDKLSNDWDWLKEQFVRECKTKNPFTFELASKHEMTLDTNPKATCYDYYERGKKYMPTSYSLRDIKKALADFNKAEELGIDNFHFFSDRAFLYYNDLNEPEKAISDFTKAIEHAKNYTSVHKAHAISTYHWRSNCYLQIGKLQEALADINKVIELDNTSSAVYHSRKIIYEQMGNVMAAEYDKFKAELVFFSVPDHIYYVDQSDFPPFYSEEFVCQVINVNYQTFLNVENYKDLVLKTFAREGEPAEPEILYSGGVNALFRRSPYQYILLKATDSNNLNVLSKYNEVVVREKSETGTVKEYTVKVRNVLELLNYVKDTITDGYPFFTTLRALLYKYPDRPIASLIPKEDLSILACILVREEDYFQLERYVAEGLPLCEDTPTYFRDFQPFPLYYCSMCLIWFIMKDPKKMLHWLLAHGANINQHAINATPPLQNQCYANGDLDIMRALLEAGADPNIKMKLDNVFYKPVTLLSNVVNFESNPNLTKKEKLELKHLYTAKEMENMKNMIALLKEFGAEEEDQLTELKIKPKSSETADKILEWIVEAADGVQEMKIIDQGTEISEWQYHKDKNTTKFIITGNITSIGRFTFMHCENLSKIDIGENVTYIGKCAFRKDNRGNMAEIKDVINRNPRPQALNQLQFFNTDLSKTLLRVPKQSLEAYRNAEGWSDFGAIIALDEKKYPPHKATKKAVSDTPKPVSPDTYYIWLGNFTSEEELFAYIDNREYEHEYLGNLLCEEGFRISPDEYELNCAFCTDHGIEKMDAADIVDCIDYNFYEKEKLILNILNILPIDAGEALYEVQKKYPDLKKANAFIVLHNWKGNTINFENSTPCKQIYYIGEFECPEPDTDGKYEPYD